MSGWRKRDEESSGQNGQRQAGATLPQTVPVVPAVPITPLVLSNTSTPPITSPEPILASVPQFCPECGGRLNSTAVYVPKFCTLCGHYLVGAAVPGSGLDALLQATSAAKANGIAAGDAAAPGSNVTLMGGLQTLMGAPRTQLYTQTLMGVSRSDLYNPPAPRARTSSTRARIQEARRAGPVPQRTRTVPAPLETRYVPLSELPTLAVPAPDAIPAPVLEPRPALVAQTPHRETRRSEGTGLAVAIFTTLLLLAVCAAALTFWLCRRGVWALPF